MLVFPRHSFVSDNNRNEEKSKNKIQLNVTDEKYVQTFKNIQ